MPAPGAYARRSSREQPATELGRPAGSFELVERGQDRSRRGGRSRPAPGLRRPRRGSETVRGVEVVVEDRARADLVPVVILGVDPEDGDGRHAVVARHLLGELERGERLEQREQRAAEQSGLLAGDDRDRAADRRAAAPLRRARGGACRRSLLRRDDRGDLGAAAIVRLRARDRVGPGGAIATDRRRRTARPSGKSYA